jgi:hypothetical protein
MDKQVFSDGIGQIIVIGGAVRLDFIAYSATEKDAKGQPMPVFCQRIILSVDGFMRSAEKIQETARAIAKLAQRPSEGQPAEAAATAIATPASEAPPLKQLFP